MKLKDVDGKIVMLAAFLISAPIATFMEGGFFGLLSLLSGAGMGIILLIDMRNGRL